MHNGYKVVDVHGHMTTPAPFRQFLAETVAQNTPGRKLELTDEQLENAQQRHLKFMDERDIDIQLIGPRPIAMWHWMRPFLQEYWCRVTNDVIARIVNLHPDRFRGMAQLPQSKERDTRNCVAELERCVKELGFVGAYLNPDPAGDKQTPGVHEEYWYSLYEKAVELDVPLMVHPSITYDRRLEIIPANYQMNNYLEEFVAMQLYSHSNVFKVFPKLKIVICHCGGGLNRFIPTDKHVGQGDFSKNLFYDCCCYDLHYLEAAIKQRGVDQMLFGTESPGSGGAVRPENGRASDDLIPVIAELSFLSAEDKKKIFQINPLKVFSKVKL
ncbi:MAG TPA: amidohydrolase family protein [Candidatus Binatia bacterium]|nr:amidohydrolase family protein [Candidatus Binatia bacterium]